MPVKNRRCDIAQLKNLNKIRQHLHVRGMQKGSSSLNKKPTNWLCQAQCCATKIRPKAVVGGIFDSFLNLGKFRPLTAGDAFSGVAIA